MASSTWIHCSCLRKIVFRERRRALVTFCYISLIGVGYLFYFARPQKFFAWMSSVIMFMWSHLVFNGEQFDWYQKCPENFQILAFGTIVWSVYAGSLESGFHRSDRSVSHVCHFCASIQFSVSLPNLYVWTPALGCVLFTACAFISCCRWLPVFIPLHTLYHIFLLPFASVTCEWLIWSVRIWLLFSHLKCDCFLLHTSN